MTGYNYWINVPAGTPFSKPLIEEHTVKPGTITNVHIEFPAGCNRFVYVQVWIGEEALVPDDKGEWLRGNGNLYPYLMDYEVMPMQGKIKIIAASPDATLDHFINVGFGHSAVPKPDTLTPAVNELTIAVKELILVMEQKSDEQSSILKRLLGGLTGGISRHTG